MASCGVLLERLFASFTRCLATLPPTAAPVAAMVLGFWVLAVTITLYNKWVFSTFGFHFPCTYIIGTLSVNWLLSALLRRHLLSLPGAVPAAPPPRRKVVTMGACTAFEIGASNLSLLTLSVSFHTMVKSSTPLFVLITAIALGLERPTRVLLTAMGLVTLGVMLCSYGEVRFNWVGFMYILTASMAGGLRWSLAQLLMQEEAPADDSSGGRGKSAGGTASGGSASGGSGAATTDIKETLQ